MSVLIKGAKMPKDGCHDCIFLHCIYCILMARNTSVSEYAWNCERHPDCPLEEVQERKKGKWENYIADTGVEHWRVIRCSECEKVAIERYNYCPHCGARMDEND